MKLRLPITNFPMRGNLLKLEAELLEKVRFDSEIETSASFIIHMGPPFTNGPLHLGHCLNLFIKEIISRGQKYYFRKNINCRIGFDCHGLPIELAVQKTCAINSRLTLLTDIRNFRAHCDEFAKNWLENQCETIEKLGISTLNYYSTIKHSSIIYEIFSRFILEDRIEALEKPLSWSIKEQTVIADIDIEYKEKNSCAVDVLFKIKYFGENAINNVSLVVWTTTPWSFMDDVAIAFNKNINYYLCNRKNDFIFIAKNCYEEFVHRVKTYEKENFKEDFYIVGSIIGEALTNLYCEHLFTGKLIPLVHSDHVDDKTGTGFVHIAPAHGPEDYEVLKNNPTLNLKIKDSINDWGYYKEDTQILFNKHIFEDEEFILATMKKNLISKHNYKHMYPYSTRTNTPIIYKSSLQLFLKYEKPQLDDFNLKSIPKSFLNSFQSSLNERKDWCVSRNRFCGVPLAVFLDKNNNVLKNEQLQNLIIKQMKEDSSYFLSEECTDILEKVGLDKTKYTPYIGVLDVWFESSCVYGIINRLDHPANNLEDFIEADVYIEGKDQIRGWFCSSSLNAYSLTKKLPYKAIISHGYVVDEKQEKLSKSKGNAPDLEDILNRFPTEILRLWVANSDITQDVVFSEAILNEKEITYRKIRNVFRYLTCYFYSYEFDEELENFFYSGKNIKTMSFNSHNSRFHILEQLILDRMNKTILEAQALMETFQIREVFNLIFKFLQYISSDYLNARKDSLYCDPEGPLLNSIYYVLHVLLHNFIILFNPFLPFTCLEIKNYLLAITQKQNKCLLNNMEEFIFAKVKDFGDKLNLLEKKLTPQRQLIEKLRSCGKINKISDLIFLGQENYKNQLADENLSIELEELELASLILGVPVLKEGKENFIFISEEAECNRCKKRIGKCIRCTEH